MPEAAARPTDAACEVAATEPVLPAPIADAPGDELSQRVRAVADGLEPLIARAQAVQELRAKAKGAPRWTDVFTTQFTEFSNRPR